MQAQSEIISIFFFFTLIALVLLLGIFIFIIQYRKRKMIHQTELIKMNQQHTEELLSTQIKMQQQTMQDIGQEIHDNVGQRLTLASIYSQQLILQNKNDEKLLEINKILSESLNELRGLSKSLTNDLIEMKDLIGLIYFECDRIKNLGVSEIHFQHKNLPTTISSHGKTFIIRILQEFSQNSLKHAACKHIFVELNGLENEIEFNLKDDGIGFDIAKKSNGIGLQNMQNRAELLNAKFHLQSELNKGTSLQISIPTN